MHALPPKQLQQAGNLLTNPIATLPAFETTVNLSSILKRRDT